MRAVPAATAVAVSAGSVMSTVSVLDPSSAPRQQRAGAAAAVVVGAELGDGRRLADHVLVGDVEAQVAECVSSVPLGGVHAVAARKVIRCHEVVARVVVVGSDTGSGATPCAWPGRRQALSMLALYFAAFSWFWFQWTRSGRMSRLGVADRALWIGGSRPPSRTADAACGDGVCDTSQFDPAAVEWHVRHDCLAARAISMSPGRGRIGRGVAAVQLAQVLREADAPVVALAVAVAQDHVLLAAGGQQAARVDLVRSSSASSARRRCSRRWCPGCGT